MYQFINTYSKENKIIFSTDQQKEKNRMLLLFGNINDTIYINDNIKAIIQEYMTYIIDIVINSKTIDNNLIDKIYNNIANEYLK